MRVLPGGDPGLDVRVLVDCEAAPVRDLPRVRPTSHPCDVDLAPLARTARRMSVMNATNSRPVTPAKTEVPYCSCGHHDDAHDVIATRFCAATRDGALTRGCICHPGPTFRSP